MSFRAIFSALPLVKLTLQIQLLPDPDQAAKLCETIERFNAAANYVAAIAFERKLTNKVLLQKLCYQELRQPQIAV